MPVPSSISDLSTTPSLNSPAGTESPSTVDDYLRTQAAFIKQVDDKATGAVKATDLAAPGGSDLVGLADGRKLSDFVGSVDLPGNDFNQAVYSGTYNAFGDDVGALSSLNAPVGSGNVRMDVFVLRGPRSITQMAIAANSGAAKVWFRSVFVTPAGDYSGSLATAPWRSLPNAEGAVFQDQASATKSLLYVEHYGDGTNGNPQTYGIDLHNYPGAKTGLVVHQYSNVGPAIWVDNTDNQPALRFNNTHNFTLNPSGPSPTSLGDFLEFQTEGATKLRLKQNYVFEAYQVTPTFLRTDGTALSVQTASTVSANTFEVVRAHTANAGSAVRINNSGGVGLNINQTGPGTAVNVTSGAAAAGLFCAVFAGYDIGLRASTSADGGQALDVRKTGTGGGQALTISNFGTGQSVSVRNGAGTELMSIEASGLLKWSAAANVQATVGGAGGASAPPATPAKWLKVIGDNGQTYVIPAYLAS